MQMQHIRHNLIQVGRSNLARCSECGKVVFRDAEEKPHPAAAKQKQADAATPKTGTEKE